MENIFPINNLYEYEYGLFNLDNYNVFFNDKTNTNNPFLISVVKDNHWLNIKPLSNNVITYEYINNTIKYNNVFNNVDIECYIEDNRVIEKYINNSNQTIFEYTLKLSETIKYEINDGRITFKDDITNDILWIISSNNGYYSIRFSNDNLILKLTLIENLDAFRNSIKLHTVIALPEIIEHRTEFTKVYDTGNVDENGSKILQQHIYLTPIHRKVNDKYEELNYNIKQTNKYEFEWINDTNNFISYFGDRTKANNHLTSFEIINSNGVSRWINFKVLNGDSTITRVDGNKIRYENILEDIDLEYLIINTQQKENIYLKSPNASKSISFTLKLDGVYLEKQDNIIKFKDIETNEILWFIDKPFMYDSSDIPIRSENIEYLLGKATIDTIEYDTLTVYANDDEFFSNAIYPIVIDPTVTLQPDGTAGKDTYVASNNPSTNYGFNSSFMIGTSSSNVPYRTYIQFDLSSVSSFSITNATLSLYCNGVSTSTSRVVNLHRVIDSWNETYMDWVGKANYDTTISASTTVGSSNSWYNFNVTSLVNLLANGTYTNNGFLLKFNDETINAYKQFVSSDYMGDITQRPKLVIDYAVPPNAPLNLQATVQSSSRILWSWTDNSSDETGFKLKDTNNTLITANLYLSDGTTPVSNGLIPAGTTSVVERGLNHNTAYTRRIYAYNANGDSTLDATGQKSATTNSLPTFNTFTGTKNGLNNLTWTINKT